MNYLTVEMPVIGSETWRGAADVEIDTSTRSNSQCAR